jgi:3-methylfumaryl-CoA hydratase
MPDIDLAPLRAQLGRKIVDEDVATEAPLRGMTVTFDRDEPPPRHGEPVPPGWHLA